MPFLLPSIFKMYIIHWNCSKQARITKTRCSPFKRAIIISKTQQNRNKWKKTLSLHQTVKSQQANKHYLVEARDRWTDEATQFIMPPSGRGNNNTIQEGWLSPTERASAQLGRLRPWDHRSKCYMDRKRIQCLSNASQHVPIYLQPFLKYSSGGSRGRGWVAPIDLTNFCINVKSHLRMHQNTHHFLVKIQFFFWGGGTAPSQDPSPRPSVPHYKVLVPPLRYSGISVASDWFSTVTRERMSVF